MDTLQTGQKYVSLQNEKFLDLNQNLPKTYPTTNSDQIAEISDKLTDKEINIPLGKTNRFESINIGERLILIEENYKFL